MNRLGLEYLTLLGATPLHFIRTAADAGCANVALFLEQAEFSPVGSLPFSLIEDAQLRRDTVKCLKDSGISIALIDGFAIFPGRPIEQHRKSFDILAELGVHRVNTVSFDTWERTVDEMPALVSMAADYNVTVTIESCPPLTVKTLAQALDLIAIVAMPNFKLLIDTMHVSRTGEAAMITKIDPALIDYVQISDGPLAMPSDNRYMDEAMFERQIPGQGEMPLVEILRNVRPDVIVSAEVPLRAKKNAGVSDLDRARLVTEGVRRVIAAAFL